MEKVAIGGAPGFEGPGWAQPFATVRSSAPTANLSITSHNEQGFFSPSTGDASVNREESSVTTKPQDEIMDIRLHRANWLAVGEVLEHQGFDVQSSIRERIELELIFLPERSEEDRLALEIAARSVGAPQPLPPYEFWLDYGDRRVSPSEMNVAGSVWFQKYRQQKLRDGSGVDEIWLSKEKRKG